LFYSKLPVIVAHFSFFYQHCFKFFHFFRIVAFSDLKRTVERQLIWNVAFWLYTVYLFNMLHVFTSRIIYYICRYSVISWHSQYLFKIKKLILEISTLIFIIIINVFVENKLWFVVKNNSVQTLNSLPLFFPT